MGHGSVEVGGLADLSEKEGQGIKTATKAVGRDTLETKKGTS